MRLSVWIILIVTPTVWQQRANLFSDLPSSLNRFNKYAQTFPSHYPVLIDAGIIDMFAENLRNNFL
ncbi:hypothetical protein [Xenorhabdus innexi]|nr:hypothetical protein [Xenorhabdus innexi]